ncbi:MAG: pyridoxal-phosphate dependent enzyme [Bacteroidota bacterium]|nr:pyridoxal-phosphate dependent enzyme [Bacteroidota bacterium]
MLTYTPLIQSLVVSFPLKADVLRLDKLHESISGNKWFKLKYNLQKAQKQNVNTIITFGGAYSNHIAATASACKLFNLNSVGIIRGEETVLNPTLIEAKENGMQLEFVSREQYSKRNEQDFKDYLQTKYGNHLLIPEGGNNKEGAIGCQEIIEQKWDYDYILCACGTATTFSGIVSNIKSKTTVIGISVLKGENNLPFDSSIMTNEISPQKKYTIMGNDEIEKDIISEHCITSNYSFNGYANYYQPLIDFKSKFEMQYDIPLDYIYTTKLFYGVFDLMAKQKFKKDSKILVIHSGGLQGNKGFEQRFKC